jgi:hypothetical protein
MLVRPSSLEVMAASSPGSSPDRPQRRDPDRERDSRTGGSAARTRAREQARWVDLQIQQAMERGEFDNLPGAGKPLGDLGSPHDRDWWLKKLVERERISVLPAALQLRKDDAELDALLDREGVEDRVRVLVTEFNRRIVEARRQLQGGPPVVTPTRDVDDEVRRWRERRQARREARREAQQEAQREAARQRATSATHEAPSRRARRRWFRRTDQGA